MNVCGVFSLACLRTLQKTKFGKVYTQTNVRGHLKNILNLISVIQTNFSISLEVKTVRVIEKSDIGKTPASDNMLKNLHVVANFQWNKNM